MGVRSEGGFCGNNEPRLRGMAFFRGGVVVVGSGEKLCFHKDCPGLMPETGGDGVLRTLSH